MSSSIAIKIQDSKNVYWKTYVSNKYIDLEDFFEKLQYLFSLVDTTNSSVNQFFQKTKYMNKYEKFKIINNYLSSRITWPNELSKNDFQTELKGEYKDLGITFDLERKVVFLNFLENTTEYKDQYYKNYENQKK